jgi:hypothetical protein
MLSMQPGNSSFFFADGFVYQRWECNRPTSLRIRFCLDRSALLQAIRLTPANFPSKQGAPASFAGSGIIGCKSHQPSDLSDADSHY